MFIFVKNLRFSSEIGIKAKNIYSTQAFPESVTLLINAISTFAFKKKTKNSKPQNKWHLQSFLFDLHKHSSGSNTQVKKASFSYKE